MIIQNNNNYGHYEVGGTVYTNKLEALQFASKTGNPVVFNFYDEVFSTCNWTKRPTGTLQELYRQRAQQLRDTYDYIVVNFSGGSDSWTTLYSFLSNGIHVDEVYTRWPLAQKKYTPANPTDFSNINHSSEYDYAVLPVLEDVAKRFPNTRICVDDYSEEYEHDFDEAKLKKGGHYLSMGSFFRYSRKSEWECEAVAQGKSVGVIYGFEKTMCHIKDGNFYAYFVDRIGPADPDPERISEAFFWSPQMPELAIAQAHELKYYYETAANEAEMALITKEITKGHSIFRDTYIRVCYPDFNLNTFQTNKFSGSIMQEVDFWVVRYNRRFFDGWRWHIKQSLTSVDRTLLDYKHGVMVGLNPLITKLHCLGKFNNQQVSKVVDIKR